MVSAAWTMPDCERRSAGAYTKLLIPKRKSVIASKLTWAFVLWVRTQVASGKGLFCPSGERKAPIHIGVVSQLTTGISPLPSDFDGRWSALAQFGDSIAKLQNCWGSSDYPINAMTRASKTESAESMRWGHYIRCTRWHTEAVVRRRPRRICHAEIPFILRTENTPESKMLVIEENMARALSPDGSDYDLQRRWATDGKNRLFFCDTAGMTNDQMAECRMHGPKGFLYRGEVMLVAIFGVSPWRLHWTVENQKGQMKPAKNQCQSIADGAPFRAEPIAAWLAWCKDSNTVIEDNNLYQHADHPMLCQFLIGAFTRASDNEPGFWSVKAVLSQSGWVSRWAIPLSTMNW